MDGAEGPPRRHQDSGSEELRPVRTINSNLIVSSLSNGGSRGPPPPRPPLLGERRAEPCTKAKKGEQPSPAPKPESTRGYGGYQGCPGEQVGTGVGRPADQKGDRHNVHVGVDNTGTT